MRGSCMLLALVLVGPACADSTPPANASSMPPGLAPQSLQGAIKQSESTFSAVLGHTVDVAMNQIQAREQAQMVDGTRPVDHVMVPGPAGRTALAYARETPDGLEWPLLILFAGPPANGKSPSVALEASYDTMIRAHKIGKMEWSDDGYYLAVLTQTTSLMGPGGDLFVVMPGVGRAKKIDRDVMGYSMSKDGRWLVYEKMKAPDDLTGPRQLMVSDGATGQVRLIQDLGYPKEQVAQLGVPDVDSGKAKVTLRDYTAGLANPKDVEAVLDLVGGRLTR